MHVLLPHLSGQGVYRSIGVYQSLQWFRKSARSGWGGVSGGGGEIEGAVSPHPSQNTPHAQTHTIPYINLNVGLIANYLLACTYLVFVYTLMPCGYRHVHVLY